MVTVIPYQNILKIRKKLDQLDNYFLNLVKKRTLLVDKVLKNKKYKKDIVDKKRIKIIKQKKYHRGTAYSLGIKSLNLLDDSTNLKFLLERTI